MAKKVDYESPEGRALTMGLLVRWMNGQNKSEISRDTGIPRRIVAKMVKKAAAAMVDTAQAAFVETVIPLAMEVYKAKMRKMVLDIEAGKDIPMAEVERVMTKMYIFDSPSLKDTLTPEGQKQLPPGAGDEVESLAAFMVKRKPRSLPTPEPEPLPEITEQVIDVEPVTSVEEAPSGDSNQTPLES